jgi:hypothetical protein
MLEFTQLFLLYAIAFGAALVLFRLILNAYKEKNRSKMAAQPIEAQMNGQTLPAYFEAHPDLAQLQKKLQNR